MEQVTSQYQLPLEMGTTPVARLTNLYSRILQSKLGTRPIINYGMAGRIFKTILRQMNEVQAAAIVIAHCNYNSAKDEWLSKQLKTRMYPLSMMLSNVNVFISYLIYERKVEFDDIDNLKEIVYKYIDRL